LACVSVISVREKCDEKSWEERSVRNPVGFGSVEFRSSKKRAREVPSTQVSAQRTDANLGTGPGI
jgi:hypothetical protein